MGDENTKILSHSLINKARGLFLPLGRAISKSPAPPPGGAFFCRGFRVHRWLRQGVNLTSIVIGIPAGAMTGNLIDQIFFRFVIHIKRHGEPVIEVPHDVAG